MPSTTACPTSPGPVASSSSGVIAIPLDDPDLRMVASGAATFPIEDRWVLFELEVDEARCNGYGDVELPEPRRWTAPGS